MSSDKLDLIVGRMVSGLAALGVCGLIVQSFAIVTDVLFRWLFNSPVQGMEDLNGLLIIAIVASFFPAVLHNRANVSINVVGKLFGPRGAEVLNSFGHLMTLIFFAILAWQLIRYTLSLDDRITQILELPVQPMWWIAAIIMAACVPVQVLVLIAHLRWAVTGSPPPGDRPEHLS